MERHLGELEDAILALTELAGWHVVFEAFSVPMPDDATIERIHRQLERYGSEGEQRQRMWVRAFIGHCRDHKIDLSVITRAP